MSLLSCAELTFSYPRTKGGETKVLTDVALKVSRGEVLGVIGPNGAGKSTLLRLCAGLLKPRSGQVRIADKDPRKLRPRELGALVGYVPQAVSLPFSFSVLDVVLQGRLPRMGRSTFESKEDLVVARDVMDRTGVWHLRDRTFDALSGGERQRAVIAAALAQQPSLLVLDEPTSALDLRFQAEVVALLRALAQDVDLAVLIALHDLNLASALCDELVLLVDGAVEARGVPEEVIVRERLEKAYGTTLHVGEGPSGPYVLAVPGRVR